MRLYFQEQCRSVETALEAARSAAARLGESRPVAAALQRLEELTAPSEGARAAPVSLRGWLHALDVAAAAPAPAALEQAVARALSATRALPHAYPHIFYVYGEYDCILLHVFAV